MNNMLLPREIVDYILNKLGLLKFIQLQVKLFGFNKRNLKYNITYFYDIKYIGWVYGWLLSKKQYFLVKLFNKLYNNDEIQSMNNKLVYPKYEDSLLLYRTRFINEIMYFWSSISHRDPEIYRGSAYVRFFQTVPIMGSAESNRFFRNYDTVHGNEYHYRVPPKFKCDSSSPISKYSMLVAIEENSFVQSNGLKLQLNYMPNKVVHNEMTYKILKYPIPTWTIPYSSLQVNGNYLMCNSEHLCELLLIFTPDWSIYSGGLSTITLSRGEVQTRFGQFRPICVDIV